jgi:hypothetical protein
MYRIRRLTGGEVTLASLDELAAAIAAGTVTAEAEIHHQRADRWLPIANHPHFKLASDRAGSIARPAPTAASTPGAPSPAPASTQPTLRLVRTDMSSPAGAAPETRPASRWTPPQRPSVPTPAPRPSGSAVPAMDPSSQVIEFVADAPAPAPVRAKRVEPATAGLPMLDIEMPQPPRPMRAPTPMPAPISWPAMHTKSRSEPMVAKPPAPMVAKAHAPVVSAPAPAPVVAPDPVPAVVLAPVPEPVPETSPIAAAVPEPVTVSVKPWQLSESSLDLPMPISDFGEPEAPTEPDVHVEFAMSAADMPAPSKSRWPMFVGGAVVLCAIAFFALRPRADVESLAPKSAATPVATKSSPAASGVEIDAQAASMRPQITPIVPPGPSDGQATEEPVAAPVVARAPKMSNMVPASAVGDLDLQIDATTAQAQRALEETRRQIQTEMQR